MRLCFKIFFALFLFLLLQSSSVTAQGVALNADPDFNNYNGDPAGPWITFKISNPGPKVWRTEKGGEGWPSGPALWIYQDAKAFDGGVYQIVAVMPGHAYHFEVAWAVVRLNGGAGAQDHSLIIRQVGIDSVGGANPLAPTVKWSGEYDGNGKFPPSTSGDLRVDEYAHTDHITIFLRARNSYTDARAEVFFDHAILTENASMGVITIVPATPTIAPATATRTVAPTQARTRVAQAPAATATLPPSPSSTSTDIPSITPQPTATRTRRPTVAVEETVNESSGTSMTNVMIAVGTLGGVGIGLVVFGVVIFRLLAHR